MFYINSAINPILYNVMSSKFRDGFKRLILGCCCGRGWRGAGAQGSLYLTNGGIVHTTGTTSAFGDANKTFLDRMNSR